MYHYEEMLPRYNTKIFSDVFPDAASFKYVFDNDFDEYAKDCITSTNITKLYWLLFARYGANPIASYSESLFKAKIVAITFQKGPTWERKLALQNTLRGLTEDELIRGASTIFNRAAHDESEPSTQTLDETPYIASQDVSKQKRSKLDAYSYLQDVLKSDVTEEFIRSFAILFSKFVSPTITHVYENEISEEEEDS